MHHKIIAWLLSVMMIWSIFGGIPLDVNASVGAMNVYKYTNKDCSMPQTGIAKTAFFMVQFPDYKNADPNLTAEKLQTKYFSAKSSESITGFYQASSLGNLTIKGTVYGWYTAAKNRSCYNGLDGNLALYQEVIAYYDAKGVDFSKFDGDSDGVIDGIYLLFAGGDTGYGSDWWSCAGYLDAGSYRADGKQLGSYIKLAADDLPTAIHETGHTLGLWDYYRMEKEQASYGIGGYDIMDDSLGDHNALSKILLGWITPKVVLGGNLEEPELVSLENSQNGGCVVYFPNGKVDYGGEYYVIEYLTQSGYYQKVDALEDGKFRILHVNGADAQGRLQVNLIEADEQCDVTGLNRWKSEDLFSNGDCFTITEETQLLLFRESENLGTICILTYQPGTVQKDTLQCETNTVLLKKKMAFSPVVTNVKGISVNQQLDWISVNEAVAKVNASGQITAKSAGHTAIIGSRENSDGSADFVIIEVYVVSSLKQISFAPKNANLTPGDQTKMTIKVSDQEITADLNIGWSVSNSRLAISKNGTVAAKKVGMATVKATLEGGLILTRQFTVDFESVRVKIGQTKAGYAKLQWNQIDGTSGYRIYRYNYKTKADPVLIATIKKNDTVTYTDKKVKSGAGYAYQVFAYDNSQSKTIYSEGSGWVNFKAP